MQNSLTTCPGARCASFAISEYQACNAGKFSALTRTCKQTTTTSSCSCPCLFVNVDFVFFFFFFTTFFFFVLSTFLSPLDSFFTSFFFSFKGIFVLLLTQMLLLCQKEQAISKLPVLFFSGSFFGNLPELLQFCSRSRLKHTPNSITNCDFVFQLFIFS